MRSNMNKRNAKFGASGALVILTSVNLFNYLDRYVVSALVESLKASELQITDTQAGLLMTSFIVVYMLMTPVFGVLGDKYSRTRIMAIGVAIWSLATFLGGFAQGFFSLICARAMVGVGEAAYISISQSILADFFPRSKQGRAFAIFFAAIPVGSAMGYILGGLVDQHYGWRAAFYIAGLPGLLLTWLTLKIEDPPRGAHEGGITQATPPILQTCRALLKNTQYTLTTLGYTAYTFGLGALAFWLPAYLERVRGISKTAASVQSGGVVVITGFVGTFVGGLIGDYYLRKSPQAYLWVSGIVTVISAPLLYICFQPSSQWVFWSTVIVGELCIFASTGLINSVVVNSVQPHVRSLAVSLSILVTHVLGDVPSPPLIGWISDTSSLAKGILLVPASLLVAGIIWLIAAKHKPAPAGV